MVLTLKAEPRTALGKKVKSLRKEGFLPAVIYGAKETAKPVVLNLKEFEKVWREAGESSLIELELGGEKKGVLIKEVQTDPVKDFPIHADFQAVSMDEKIEAEVNYLRIAVEKTAGEYEWQAWGWLMERIDNHKSELRGENLA